jgi:hypothetical protein
VAVYLHVRPVGTRTRGPWIIGYIYKEAAPYFHGLLAQIDAAWSVAGADVISGDAVGGWPLKPQERRGVIVRLVSPPQQHENERVFRIDIDMFLPGRQSPFLPGVHAAARLLQAAASRLTVERGWRHDGTGVLTPVSTTLTLLCMQSGSACRLCHAEAMVAAATAAAAVVAEAAPPLETMADAPAAPLAAAWDGAGPREGSRPVVDVTDAEHPPARDSTTGAGAARDGAALVAAAAATADDHTFVGGTLVASNSTGISDASSRLGTLVPSADSDAGFDAHAEPIGCDTVDFGGDFLPRSDGDVVMSAQRDGEDPVRDDDDTAVVAPLVRSDTRMSSSVGGYEY